MGTVPLEIFHPADKNMWISLRYVVVELGRIALSAMSPLSRKKTAPEMGHPVL